MSNAVWIIPLTIRHYFGDIRRRIALRSQSQGAEPNIAASTHVGLWASTARGTIWQRTMPEPTPLETDDVVVLVVGAPGAGTEGRLEGVTRLEKLIFLLERETPVQDWLTEKAEFRSWRFGPFSSKVYDAADTLAAAGLLRDSAKTAHSSEDRWEALNALVDEEEVDPYTTRTFELTDRGKKYYEALLSELPPEAQGVLSNFKKQFAALPLRQLVRYVYERYPQFTDQSEIRDEILR